MDERVNSSSAVPMNRQQAMKKLRAVDIMPARSTQSSSFITVHIGNCSVRVSDSTDLSLLKMISEAFDHD